LQQQAFKGAATFRAMRINGAFAAVERGAGLKKEGIVFDLQAGEFEASGFGSGEFDIGKKRTTATQAAACAENGFKQWRHARGVNDCPHHNWESRMWRVKSEPLTGL
jgi:hypothetical protein